MYHKYYTGIISPTYRLIRIGFCRSYARSIAPGLLLYWWTPQRSVTVLTT